MSKETTARWQKEHPEAMREAAARWRARHPEKHKENKQKYLEKNPGKAAEYTARYRAMPGNKEKARDKRRHKEYGLTPEEFAVRMAFQNGRCAICREPMTVPCIDHDHTTGLVRGLLCKPCNLGIGNFGDQPEHLMAAAIYLEEG